MLARMPEGDTLARTARSLRQWLVGQQVTSARSTVEGVDVTARLLVGQRVTSVEARAKHLLIRFSGGSVLHTHMRMTGEWHVYPAGESWSRAADDARFVIECGTRVAVCFKAPVVQLWRREAEATHPALVRLGPDILEDEVDAAEVRRRAVALLETSVSIAELLLDQRVVSGIGNIWRSESLFACRVDPSVPWAQLSEETFDRIVRTASQLMRASAAASGRRTRMAVYGRPGQGCPRCDGPIAVRRLPAGRTVFWCPRCQRT